MKDMMEIKSQIETILALLKKQEEKQKEHGEKIDKIFKILNDMQTNWKVTNIKVSNHDDRLNYLEQAQLKTVQNCSEYIPKVKQACARSEETAKELKGFKNQIIVAFLGFFFSVLLAIIELFRRGG